MMRTENRKKFLHIIVTICLMLFCELIGLWSAKAKADYGWTNTSMNTKMVDFTYELTFDEVGNPIASIDYPFKEMGANAAMATYMDENNHYFELNFVYTSGILKLDPKAQGDKETFSAHCRAIQDGKASLKSVKVGKINPTGGKEGWGWEKEEDQRTTFEYEYSNQYTGFNTLNIGETRYSISYANGNITSSSVLVTGNGSFLMYQYDEKGQIFYGYCYTPEGEVLYNPATGLFDGKPATEFGFQASVMNLQAPAAIGVSAKAEGSDSTEQMGTQIGGDTQEEHATSGKTITLVELIDSSSDTAYIYNEGFGIPVFAGENRKNSELGYEKTKRKIGSQTSASGLRITTVSETGSGFVRFIKQILGDSVEPWNDFLEDTSDAIDRYDMVKGMLTSIGSIESEIIEIDGHPASLSLYSNEKLNGLTGGYILYFRNNAALFSLLVQAEPVTMDDLKLYASYIQYDENQASITQTAGQIELSASKNPHFLTAGKKMQIKAKFADEKLIKKQMPSESIHLRPMIYEGEALPGTIPIEGGYIFLSMSKGSPTSLAWYVADAETGETVKEGITVDSKGTVIVDKDLKEPRNIIVKAESGLFHTEAGYELTVVPAATDMTVEPAEVVLYEGTSEEQTLKAILTPDTFQPTGIQWTAAKKGIVELILGKGGAAVVKPISAGKTTLTVTEPSGKKATVKISVLSPITDLELTTKGKPIPGGTITGTATIIPKNAGNKELEWSLDVGEEIATCNKGVVKISKNAPVGTVITITCKAIGAPEPVVKTVQIEVTEK